MQQQPLIILSLNYTSTVHETLRDTTSEYIRAQEHEYVVTTVGTVQKTFRTSKKCWLKALHYAVVYNTEQAPIVLQQALHGLPSYKIWSTHV